ncbi:MAG: Cu(I)-responsive transcriptional regulator [Parvibaculaceae bacterium]
MNIAQASGASGLPPKTIRYYEEIGLLKPARLPNGYRDYGHAEVHALRFLQRARSLGFSVEDCRVLLSLYRDRERASAEVKSVAQAHLKDIRRKIAELQGLAATLERLCEACSGDERPDCPIIEGLATPPEAA